MGKPNAWNWVAVTALIGAVVGGGLYHMSKRADLRREVEHDLLILADFKAKEIANWFHERQADASILSQSLSLSKDVSLLLDRPAVGGATGADRHLAAAVLQRLFTSYCEAYGYSQVQLVDGHGRVVASATGEPSDVDPLMLDVVVEAMKGGDVRLVDLHTCANEARPHLSLMAPVRALHAPGDPPGGVVVLMSRAGDVLHPLIQAWPRPSRTGETLLVRQEGDSILFLNDLRHPPQPALSMRLPLTTPGLPAARALAGEMGVMRGVDYRGVDVLAAAAPVAGTPWAIIAKEDAAEAMSVMRHESTLILLMIAALLLAAGGTLALLRQREARRHLQDQLEKEWELGRAARRHQVVLHSIGDAVISTDAQGRVELMNPEAEWQTGWTLSEARGRPLEEVFHIVNEDTGKVVESPVTKVIRERKVVGLANHTKLVTRSGAGHPIADSGAPIEEDDGSLSGVVLVFRDQTGERAAQRILTESEARFRATFEQAAVGMAHTDPEGRVLRVNQAACHMLGYSFAELAAMTYQQVSHPEELAEDLATRGRLLTGSESSYTREKRLVRKDGSLLWVEVTVSLVRSEDGTPAYFFSVLQDITRRKAEESRRLLLQSAVEQVGETVLLTDAAATIVFVNPAFEQTTGYTRDEVLGRNPRMLKSGRHGPEFYQEMWEVLTRGEVFKCQMVNKRKDGSLFTEHATIAPVRGPMGDVTHYVSVKRDITLEIELEQQLRQSQKMEAVGRLAGGVAHDFNNILQAMLGYGNMLQATLPAGSEEAEFVDEIVNGAERAAALTRQLLAFSRKQNIQPRVLNLNDTIVGMLRLLGRLITEDIDLQWHPGHDLHPVLMDPEQINQILVNLVVNSRDAIDGAGTVTIETAAAVFDDEYCAHHDGAIPGNYVLLAVSDTGCGMDDEVRVKIFEPFFTTKELGKGTGLGLATVYGIVKQNNGYINVYSEVGRGATFRIYLPEVADGVVVRDVAEAGKALRGGSETILLVEDEMPLLRFAEHLLTSMGYTVLAAGSPMRALELARSCGVPIHLLLTDVVMPQMSGRDLHAALREKQGELKCLYMSGYTSNVIAHRGILEEGVHFLAKPFTRKELAMKLRSILDS
jgi:PAS domain S-box-containing protein